MKVNLVTIGDLFLHTRLAKKIKQADVARATGLHETTIGKIEKTGKGATNLGLSTFVLLCDALGLDPVKVLKQNMDK
jgi:transcriptional regulator with XRE-family HTH domain